MDLLVKFYSKPDGFWRDAVALNGAATPYVIRRVLIFGAFAALVLGVDEPWEVCLLKLLFEVVRLSAPGNARDLRADPDGTRHQIDHAFRLAANDKSRLAPLADLLNRLGQFKDYEDRFFALVRSHSR